MNVVTRFAEWLMESSERRRSPRYTNPELVAYGGLVPVSTDITDVSYTGLYLRTDERWYPGTRLRLTLSKSKADLERCADTDFLLVNCEVIRRGRDGVGLRFLTYGKTEREDLIRFLGDALASATRRNAALKAMEEQVKMIVDSCSSDPSDSERIGKNSCTPHAFYHGRCILNNPAVLLHSSHSQNDR